MADELKNAREAFNAAKTRVDELRRQLLTVADKLGDPEKADVVGVTAEGWPAEAAGPIAIEARELPLIQAIQDALRQYHVTKAAIQ